MYLLGSNKLPCSLLGLNHSLFFAVAFFVITLASCLFSSLVSSAPILKIDSQQADLALDDYLNVFHDESAALDLLDVLQPEYARKFSPLIRDSAHFGFTDAILWLRFNIRNLSGQPEDFFLQLRMVDFSLFEVYRLEGKSNNFKQVFNLSQLEERDLFSISPGIQIPLGRLPDDAAQVYYIKVASDYALNVDARVQTIHAAYDYISEENSSNSFVLGLLFALFLFSMLLFAYYRKGVLLLAALSVLCSIGYVRSVMGYPGLLSSGPVNFSGNSVYLFGYLGALCVLAMAIIVLRYSGQYRRFVSVFSALFCACIVGFFGTFLFDEQWTNNLFLLLNSMLALFGFGFFLSAYSAERKHYFLLFGSTFALMMIQASASKLFDISSADSISYGVLGNSWMHVLVAVNVLLRLTAVFLYCIQLRDDSLQEKFMNRFNSRLTSNQSSLLSKLTHEIRTPMSGILGMTELLRSTELTDTQIEFADTLDRSGYELLNIIDDVTAYAHIQNGTLPVQHQSFDVSEMLEGLLLAAAPEAERRNVELVSFPLVGQSPYVYGDAIRTRHVIGNLLSYSISHLRDGEIIVRASVSSTELCIIIEDNGSGYAAEELQQVFSAQNEGHNLVPHEGGIGLPLSRKITEALQGSLDIGSNLGLGTRFTVRLPVKEGVPQASRSLDTSLLRELRLLVVDDSKVCCDVIQQHAVHWGVVVDSCLSGSEAFAMLRAKETMGEPYQILLVDYAMPGMSGLQLAEKIQQEPLIDDEKLIVIMLTGLNIAPGKDEVKALGISDVVSKPLTAKVLQRLLLGQLECASSEAKIVKNAEQSSSTLTDPDALQLPTRHFKVLLAEDNEISARVIERMLHRIGASTQVVENGEEALLALQRAHFDFVLMDCEMPVMDGFEATELVRQWERDTGAAHTPIVALTAHLLEQLQDRIVAAGMDDQVSKPIRIHELLSLLQKWVPNFQPLSNHLLSGSSAPYKPQ